ncbi:MAG TPA: DUF3247 family protein [Rhodanobacter sp.]
MGRTAQRVYTDQAGIRQLELLVAELPAGAHVVLVMKDGSTCDGVVSARPSVRLFRDRDGNEGSNARVQLRRPDVAGWSRRFWVDQIARVEHVDSTNASGD